MVRTGFTGSIKRDVISGTYTTITAWGGRQEGEWRVVRAAP